MILYNITTNIDQIVEIQWVEWMQTFHINAVLNTGCFINAKFSRLTSHREPNSTNYIVQYMCESDEKLKKFKSEFEPKLKHEAILKFGDKIQFFYTELKIIEDYYPNQN